MYFFYKLEHALNTLLELDMKKSNAKTLKELLKFGKEAKKDIISKIEDVTEFQIS